VICPSSAANLVTAAVDIIRLGKGQPLIPIMEKRLGYFI
jgi:hypothetical protein